MTPQERQLIDDLFDRLAKLENAPRDAEAVAAISQGLRRAPNAAYVLVQTALVQDEALKRANDRIQELEAALDPQQSQSGGGFLDSMRDAIFGQGQTSRGSVPSVRPPEQGGRPVWNSGQAPQQGQPPFGGPQPGIGGGGGGSFLGTAAAAAAGVVGGSLLLNSIRSMTGGGQHQSLADSGSSGESKQPWGDQSRGDQSRGDLARDAGVNDIGSSGSHGGDRDQGSRAGAFDQASNDDYDQDNDNDFDDGDGDGGSDYA